MPCPPEPIVSVGKADTRSGQYPPPMVATTHISTRSALLRSISVLLALGASLYPADGAEQRPIELLENFCFDCHDEVSKKGGFSLETVLSKEHFDGTLPFENILTGKMPPREKRQPNAEEKLVILHWLAQQQNGVSSRSFRRLSRHEFVHSLNDLLGTNLDLADRIAEDRGTNDFDSDRRIQLSREALASYFDIADQMLESAFPAGGFPVEQQWETSKVRDSHASYRIYHRPHEEGTLFSWTRANNGNSYSFFLDNFDPPEPGWYELTFDAAKVAKIPEDLSLQVYAGKYYFADDRPQPQRLVGVISLGDREVRSYTIRAFLRPGENVSVHCYSRHNFRSRDPEEGIYIRKMTARGPTLDSWPPSSYMGVFDGIALEVEPRLRRTNAGFQTNLQRIGGRISVSSFQRGMEKEKMQDGSNRTFWHTRFAPTVAKAPHFVVFENPAGADIAGLSFSTWTGGNGNGLVKAYEIYFSEDGRQWGRRVMAGRLDIRLAKEQPILFPEKTTRRFIKFLVTDSVQLDEKSIASIGKLDVISSFNQPLATSRVRVSAQSPAELKGVIRRFAERAFCSQLSEDELGPYFDTALSELGKNGFLRAAKVGMKAVLCSPRFLMLPGEHSNPSYARAAELARILWLSVPDEELLRLAASDELRGKVLRRQVSRMLSDERSQRMIRSFSDQWLNLRSLNKVAPSLKLYPLFDDLMNHYLPVETRSYLQHLIHENMPAGNLIDSDFSFLNQRLARHYGIPGVVGQEIRKVQFSPEVPRGGILTMASVLKVTTDGFDTSPILRGAWISKNIVGIPLSPPPESVAALEPEHDNAETLKEQIAQHTESKACSACHKSIDPYGFALENFDAVGEWRERYKIKQSHGGTFQYRPQGYFKLGRRVDASGKIDGQEFTGIIALKKVLLADERKIAYNFAKKFFEYAKGRKPDLSQRIHLWSFLGRNPGNSRLQTLLTEVLEYSVSGGAR